jgi:hypothetical protein
MAERDRRNRHEDVHLEDVVEVGSRVSWGAILAGAVMALAVCFVLQLLGQALGVSLSEQTSADSLGFGAAIWAVISSMAGLFAGGWITSQCVVGETKTESVVHGIIMWGVALAMMLWGTASGISPNFTAMMQVASMAGVTTEPGSRHSFTGAAAGAVPQDFAPRVSQPANPSDENAQAGAPVPSVPVGSQFANAPHDRASADRATTQATWWTLATTVLSIAAAIAGAFVGAGPTFRLLPLHVSHRQASGRGAVAGPA